ncbi:MAG: hypothetical protein ACAI35_04635, partial [Candidatus Methylacidiphilales bacterium]
MASSFGYCAAGSVRLIVVQMVNFPNAQAKGFPSETWCLRVLVVKKNHHPKRVKENSLFPFCPFPVTTLNTEL